MSQSVSPAAPKTPAAGAAAPSALDLGTAPLGRLLVRYSLPAITGMLVQALYNVADRFYLGNGVGAEAIAGVAVGFPLMLVLMAFGMLVGIGGSAAFSIFLGQKREAEAETALGNSFTLLVVITLVITVAGLIWLDPLMRLFGASDATLPYASNYMRIVLGGSVFNGIGFGLNNFIRADGDPKRAMNTMIIGAVLNIALDPLFIFGFGMGVEGAAWATALSMFVSSLLVIGYFLGPKSRIKLRLPALKLNPAISLRILAIGSAPFLMQIAASVLNALLNNQLQRYGGDLAISVMGIIYAIALFFLMPVFGINQGVGPILGFNYGARLFGRVLKAHSLAALAATAVTLGAGLAIVAAPLWFLGLFNRDAAVLALGGRVAWIFFLLFPVIGFQIVSANYYQSVGKPTQAMFLSLSRQVIFLIPLLLILPGLFESWGRQGLEGVFWAIPVSDGLAVLVTGAFFLVERRHLRAGDALAGPAPLEPVLSPTEAPHAVDPVNNRGEVL